MSEGMQILFGKKITSTTFDDGSELRREEAMVNGKVVGEYAHYQDTIKDPSEQEVLTHFLQFQEFMHQDRRRINPEFSQKTDERSGRTILIYKRWTERLK